VGGLWYWGRNNLNIDLGLRLALGAMTEDVSIRGGSAALLPTGAVVGRDGGFLALATNSGDHSRTKLALLRNFSVGVSYSIHEYCSIRLGYDVLWVSGVVRPGEQADLLINPTLLPFSATPPTGPRLPGFRFNDEVFWMHGVSLGVTFQF
jgi:hypothetical protein